MYKSVIVEIEKLSQEEGMFDDEIAEMIGCTRATVNRYRNKYSIPTANLANRCDKEYVCSKCHKTIRIRRKERRRLYCPSCAK